LIYRKASAAGPTLLSRADEVIKIAAGASAFGANQPINYVRVDVCFARDSVAKLFLGSKRATLIQDHTCNIDSKVSPFRFNCC
jgi:hypothetical protein